MTQQGRYLWSSHALERWTERFPGIDREGEFNHSTLASKSNRRKIRKLCPVSAQKFMQGFNERFFLIGRSNVVFVVDSISDTIITVFHLYGDTATRTKTLESDR